MADLSHDPSVDLSAAAYSRKKSAELQRIRDSKSKRDSVAKIIEKMNEKGIGGVSLNGVHVEAFIHKQVEESGMEEGSEGHAEAYERALKAALAHAESGEFDGGVGGQGGRGGGDHRVDRSDRSGGRGTGVRGMASSFTGASSTGSGGDGGSPTNASMEAYLSQAFASARGLHGDEWKAGRDVHGYKSPDDHADAEADEYVVPGAGELRVEKADAAAAAKAREGARAFRSAVGDAKGGTEKSPEERAYEARMRRAREGNADQGEGVYKEAATPKEKGATKYQRGSRTIGRENDAPQASGRLSPERTFDASRVGVDPLTATAYSTNAAHNVPYSARKLQNAGMGDGAYGDGEESPQKDVEEVVEDMADRQARRLAESAEAGTEEVHVPEKDEAEVEYEARMKAMREEARRENAERPAGTAVHVPSEAVAEMEMADEEMKKKLVKEPKVQDSGPPVGEDGSAAGVDEEEEDGEGDEAVGDEAEGEADGEAIGEAEGDGEAEVDSGEANDNDEAEGNAGADDNGEADDNGAVDTPADGEFDDFMAVLAASEHEGEGDAAQDESADADEEGKEGAEGATAEENEDKGGDDKEDFETEVVEEAKKTPEPEVHVEQKPAESKTNATARETVDAADVQVPEAAAGCCCVIS